MLLWIPLSLRKLQSYFLILQLYHHSPAGETAAAIHLILARHAIAAREEPKDVCAGSRLQSFLLSEQARTSVVVTKLTSLYWSLSLLHRSYADIVSLARFSLRVSGLHNSFGSLLFSKLKKRESPRLVEGHVWCPSTNSKTSFNFSNPSNLQLQVVIFSSI